jgi:hypothetical protein
MNGDEASGTGDELPDVFQGVTQPVDTVQLTMANGILPRCRSLMVSGLAFEWFAGSDHRDDAHAMAARALGVASDRLGSLLPSLVQTPSTAAVGNQKDHGSGHR